MLSTEHTWDARDALGCPVAGLPSWAGQALWPQPVGMLCSAGSPRSSDLLACPLPLGLGCSLLGGKRVYLFRSF